MCDDCGCDISPSRTIKLEHNVLEKNAILAQKNLAWFNQNKIHVLNLISSPGTGKTLLLEKTLKHFASNKIQIIVGDLKTDNDCQRLQQFSSEVKQINTHSSCHLDAHMIHHEIDSFVKKSTNLLIIENVGNLVCPSTFDLGEHAKVALISTTEGEDKPLKYPELFLRAQVVVITKTDLIPHLDWNRDETIKNIKRINPLAYIVEVSAKSDEGMFNWYHYLENKICA